MTKHTQTCVFVKVMPEYASNGIWHRDGIHAEPVELPISKSLLARLAQWSGWYNINDDYLPVDDRKNRLDWDKFEQEGVAIARAIKRELPEWTVVWSDERKLKALILAGPERRPRSAFEFEVLSNGSLVPVSSWISDAI
ncbi:hypothetical protein CBA19CS22_12115 [Caballeronia novacaledonica]|uniref:Uncharacterized protein n=1 Tax=Caballeronia novacaledonica TaxID=1544861 RepID=A0ACB5QRH5_9BURK|nr:hypothetical protein CBA19CS22_12115 [Caballeronia novacaledonica]